MHTYTHTYTPSTTQVTIPLSLRSHPPIAHQFVGYGCDRCVCAAWHSHNALMLVSKPAADDPSVVRATHIQDVHIPVKVCGMLHLTQMALQRLNEITK